MLSKTPHKLHATLWLAVGLCLTLFWADRTSADPRDSAPPRNARPEFRPPPLSDEQIALAVELIGSARPELLERLNRLQAQDPEAYRKAVHRVVTEERLHHLLMMREFDPEGFEFRADEWRAGAQALRLARRLREAKEADAATIKQELRAVVEQQFDARLKVREHELAQLEQRLEHLRKRLQASRQNRDRFIEEQFKRMVERPAQNPALP